MFQNQSIVNTAKTVLTNCMAVRESEQLLIVTDEKQIDLAYNFAAAGRKLGVNTILLEITSQEGGEPPKLLAEAMLESDVALLITKNSLTHTHARAEASKSGVRIASMPLLTEEIAKTVLNISYDKIKKDSNILREQLTKASKVRVVTDIGTDVTLYIEGRKSLADTGKITKKGDFGNLPAGETMIAPNEEEGTGTIVVDGAITGLPELTGLLTIEILDGKIIDVIGKDAKSFVDWVKQFDNNSDRIAEFGIGTNYEAKIMGNPIVDEKVLGTIHIAFGNNLFMGGEQDSNIHYDMIIKYPTVYVDDEKIIDKGEHLIEA